MSATPQPENHDSSKPPKPPDYYRKRFDLLLFPAIVIFLYHGIFVAAVSSLHILKNINVLNIGFSLSIQGFLLLAAMLAGYLGTTRDTESVRLYSLIVCVILFMISVALPIFFWGGSNRSCFSPLLPTIAGLAVVTSTSPSIRLSLAGMSVVLFGCLSVWFIKVDLNTEVILFNSLTGEGAYSVLQTLSAIVCMLVTIPLIWKRSKSTLFDSDDSPVPHRSTH